MVKPSPAHWWQDQVDIVTWGALSNEKDARWIDFARATGAEIMDRAFLFQAWKHGPAPDTAHEQCRQAAEFFHSRGFKFTSFMTAADPEGTNRWDPSPAAVDSLLAELKKHVDDGCDGVHLDVFNAVKIPEGAAAQVRKLRGGLHEYGREKYGREVMFAGNIWRLEDPFSLDACPNMDAVWIESFGDSDAEVVRIARVGKAAGGGRPVWYHWQPNDDTEQRVSSLGNLSRALFSSCLMENAVFLCNYKYPVKAKGKWEFFYINDRWEKNVLQYSKFAREYRDCYLGAEPRAAVLVAYQPKDVAAANKTMDALLARGVNFNVLVHGGESHPAPRPEGFKGYAAVIAPGGGLPADIGKRFEDSDAFFKDVPREVGEFLTIDGAPNVLGRVMVKGNKRILHIKQIGYTDKADSLPATGPLTVTMLAPGVSKGFFASPDRGGKTELSLTALDQGRVRFTVPGVEYYAMVVME
jgi:hypothetical protein